MLCIHKAQFPVSSLWKFSQLTRGMKTILIEALMTDKPRNGPRWKRPLHGLRSLTIMKRKLRLGKGKDFLTLRMAVSSVADPDLGKLELSPLPHGTLGKLLACPILQEACLWNETPFSPLTTKSQNKSSFTETGRIFQIKTET